jgi:hypothetical protein
MDKDKSVPVLPKSNAAVGKAFDSIINGLGRDDIGEILFNWNEPRFSISAILGVKNWRESDRQIECF